MLVQCVPPLIYLQPASAQSDIGPLCVPTKHSSYKLHKLDKALQLAWQLSPLLNYSYICVSLGQVVLYPVPTASTHNITFV